jgi:hypothetical protein
MKTFSCLRFPAQALPERGKGGQENMNHFGASIPTESSEPQRLSDNQKRNFNAN